MKNELNTSPDQTHLCCQQYSSHIVPTYYINHCYLTLLGFTSTVYCFLHIEIHPIAQYFVNFSNHQKQSGIRDLRDMEEASYCINSKLYV